MNFSFENRGSESKINFLSFQNDKSSKLSSQKIFEKCRDYYSRIKNVEYLLCNLQLVLEFNIAQIVTPPRGKI